MFSRICWLFCFLHYKCQRKEYYDYAQEDFDFGQVHIIWWLSYCQVRQKISVEPWTYVCLTYCILFFKTYSNTMLTDMPPTRCLPFFKLNNSRLNVRKTNAILSISIRFVIIFRSYNIHEFTVVLYLYWEKTTMHRWYGTGITELQSHIYISWVRRTRLM